MPQDAPKTLAHFMSSYRYNSSLPVCTQLISQTAPKSEMSFINRHGNHMQKHYIYIQAAMVILNC